MTDKDWKRLLFRVRADIMINEVPLDVSILSSVVAQGDGGGGFSLLLDLLDLSEEGWKAYVADALKEGEELDAMMVPLLKMDSIFTGTLFCKNCDHEGDEPDFITDDHEVICPECLSIKIGRRREP